MVQKTVKLLIFLNHNLVGFKNTRTFVLKEKGRFFGAIPSIFSLHQRAIIHSKNMRIASPFAVASRARTYYIYILNVSVAHSGRKVVGAQTPRVLPWAKRQAGLSARIHHLICNKRRTQKMPPAFNLAIHITLPFITYYLPI